MGPTIATKKLSADAALTVAQAAVRHGLSMGVKVNVAVTDAGGHLLAFWKADGAFLPSVQIAMDKAYTAVGFGISSRQLATALRDDDASVRDGIQKQQRVAAFPGGLPIVEEGELVGGVGVSGASAEQDEQCALAGIAAIGLNT